MLLGICQFLTSEQDQAALFLCTSLNLHRRVHEIFKAKDAPKLVSYVTENTICNLVKQNESPRGCTGIHCCHLHQILKNTKEKKLTYLLTPWCRVLLEKLTGLQLVKKFPAFYGTRRFITAFSSFRHPSLSWASPIQSTHPQPTSCRSILILSTHLHLGFPSGLFPSGFPTRTLYAPSPPPYEPHAQPISFYHPHNIG